MKFNFDLALSVKTSEHFCLLPFDFMRLIVLGSGTSVPHAQRSSSAYWLETGGGSLLLDISPSALHRMAEENCDWTNLDSIWASHFHLDHIGGLAPFLFGTKHAPETRNRTKPLNIFGPEGLKRLIDAFDAANNYRLNEQPFQVKIQEVKSDESFEILPNVMARAFKTPHTNESLALSLSDGEVSIVFTSDTGFDERLAEFARRVDLLLTECSFVSGKPIQKHLELDDVMTLARIAQPKKVLLSHLYPEWDDVDIEAEISKRNPACEIIAATDGLRLEIR
jgi:ribonuclease BN (tRNA processing enzyme)